MTTTTTWSGRGSGAASAREWTDEVVGVSPPVGPADRVVELHEAVASASALISAAAARGPVRVLIRRSRSAVALWGLAAGWGDQGGFVGLSGTRARVLARGAVRAPDASRRAVGAGSAGSGW